MKFRMFNISSLYFPVQLLLIISFSYIWHCKLYKWHECKKEYIWSTNKIKRSEWPVRKKIAWKHASVKFYNCQDSLSINRATYYFIRKKSNRYFKPIFRNLLVLQYFKLKKQTPTATITKNWKRRINLTAVADKSNTERKCLIHNIL